MILELVKVKYLIFKKARMMESPSQKKFRL